MLLVLSITFYFHYKLWGCLCSSGPFWFRWLKGYIYSSCCYHHQIGSVPLSHCYHISPWLCARDVCYIILWHLLHIRSGKRGNLFSLLLSENIWIIQCLSDIFCRVCKIKHILSVIHYTICGAVFFQFTYFPCDDWENTYTWSYYHHQIESMNYYPLFRVRSWNNGVRCMSFFFLIGIYMYPYLYNVVTDPWPYFKGGWMKPPLKSGSELVIICNFFTLISLLIPAL